MTDTNDGGPAYPEPVTSDEHGTWTGTQCGAAPGMTLRDYFAAAAMKGLVRDSEGAIVTELVQRLAADSYVIADAMLAERAKEVGDE